MSNYIITRHPGAVEWFRRHVASGGDMQIVAHLEEPAFGPGDKVLGVLPLGLAADVCASGAEVHVLTYEAPAHLRGQELSADDLERLDARLIRYDVRVVGDVQVAAGGLRDD